MPIEQLAHPTAVPTSPTIVFYQQVEEEEGIVGEVTDGRLVSPSIPNVAVAYGGEAKEEEREGSALRVAVNGDVGDVGEVIPMDNGKGNDSSSVGKAETESQEAVPVDDAGLDRVRTWCGALWWMVCVLHAYKMDSRWCAAVGLGM